MLNTLRIRYKSNPTKFNAQIRTINTFVKNSDYFQGHRKKIYRITGKYKKLAGRK